MLAFIPLLLAHIRLTSCFSDASWATPLCIALPAHPVCEALNHVHTERALVEQNLGSIGVNPDSRPFLSSPMEFQPVSSRNDCKVRSVHLVLRPKKEHQKTPAKACISATMTRRPVRGSWYIVTYIMDGALEPYVYVCNLSSIRLVWAGRVAISQT